MGGRFAGGVIGAAIVGAGMLLGACAERAPRSTGMGRVSIVNDERLGLRQVEGVIKHVDPESGRLVLEEGGRELHLEAGPHTSVFVRGGVSDLQALEEGAEVRASFSEEGLRKVVRWIEVPREEQIEAPDSREIIDAPAAPTVPPPPSRVLPPIESMDQDAVKKTGEEEESEN